MSVVVEHCAIGLWRKVESSMPGRVQFIEELCDLVTANQSIPDMWQLAHAYFSEKLVEKLSVSKGTLEEQEDKCKVRNRTVLLYWHVTTS